MPIPTKLTPALVRKRQRQLSTATPRLRKILQCLLQARQKSSELLRALKIPPKGLAALQEQLLLEANRVPVASLVGTMLSADDAERLLVAAKLLPPPGGGATATASRSAHKATEKSPSKRKSAPAPSAGRAKPQPIKRSSRR